MVVQSPKTKTDRCDEWRVAKKITPSQRGALKLTCSYGAELLCVRYRENPEATERLSSVELGVERTVIQKRNDPMVSFKIRQEELEPRRLAMSRGGAYDGRNYVWPLCRSEILRTGLRGRIAVFAEEFDQEQVHP